jgi:hypothetical protein
MIIKTKKFHEVLTRCFKFVTEREFSSTGFKCFNFEGNTIRAFAKDKGIGIVYTMPEECNFGGSYFVLADFLVAALASFLKTDSLDVEFRNNKLYLDSGTFHASIAVSIPEEAFHFPKLPEEINPLPEQFSWFVDKIFFAAMGDPVTFDRFSGIFVDKGTFFATNNIVIAKYESDLNLNETFTIPDELVSAVRSDKNSVIRGYCFDNKFWLKYTKKGTDENPEPEDEFLTFANTLEKLLDVMQLREWFDDFPKDRPVCEYVQDDALQSLEAIEPWTDTTSKRMTFELEKNKMTFIARNELGEASEEVRCDYVGEPLSFIFMFDEFKACIERMKKFSANVTGGRCKLYFTEGGPLQLLLISLLD